MHIKNLFKKIFNIKSAAQAQMDYYISQGLNIGKNLRLNSDYAFDALFPWLITVGDNVCISANVKILAHDTSTEYVNNHTKIGAVTIGDNVYIGYGSIILCNVHIGNNAIIGAGSVVSKDVPANTVCAGNPAKVICSLEEYRSKHIANLQNHLVLNGPSKDWENKTIDAKSNIKQKLSNNFGYMK